MIPQSLRAKVVDEARRDAAAYFREFRGPVGPDTTNWVAEAWANLRRDFKLAPGVAKKLWPSYWEAFAQETARLTSSPGQ